MTRKVVTWIRWLENWRVDVGFYGGCVEEWGRVWRWEIGERGGAEIKVLCWCGAGAAGGSADVGGSGVLVCVVSKENITQEHK